MFWILILALLLIVKVCSIVNFSQHHINVQVTDQVHGNWHLGGLMAFQMVVEEEILGIF
jgi:hypothetical protein